MILAGGRGTRLYPLTAKRSKPAVPFGAKYRIIDFVLNNFVNSGIFSIYVLIQYKAQSLTEHIQRYWRFGAFLNDHFIVLVPAQMYLYEELGPVWYRGTADAIYQNLHLIENHNPRTVAVFGGDHIYKMDVRHMLAFHQDQAADITIAAYPVPIEEASRFGVIQVDRIGRILSFEEKPKRPKPLPDDPTRALVSMGNYLFKTDVLKDLVREDAEIEESGHDFGNDVLPRALRQGYRLFAYDFFRNPIPGEPENTYWKDVGTVDAYFEASMDLVQEQPPFDLFNPEWPLRTANLFSPPAKFIREETGRVGQAINSLVAGGVVVSGGTVRQSVLFRRVRVGSWALVERSVLFDDVTVGRRARLKNVIVDKEVCIPEGIELGYDLEADRERGLTVTKNGVVVVPKGYVFKQ